MPRNARKQGFSRRHRFAARGSFAPVLRSPRKLRGALAVIHVAPASTAVSRLGVALTRRLVRSSVDRNRIKRLVREAFRLHPAKHAGVDCVVMLRSRFEATQLVPMNTEIRALLDQLTPGEAAR
jgi:ribonuclease P protein component